MIIAHRFNGGYRRIPKASPGGTVGNIDFAKHIFFPSRPSGTRFLFFLYPALKRGAIITPSLRDENTPKIQSFAITSLIQ